MRHALGQIEGVQQTSVQEQSAADWASLLAAIRAETVDIILWTSTSSLADQVGPAVQYQMLDWARRAGIPTVGYHLDRWWGLERQKNLDRPFFACERMFTADGGHEYEWAKLGINHTWMPPAISERWCYLSDQTPPREWQGEIVFVGGWHQYGHREWTHRGEMIAKVDEWYGDRFRCLPRRGQPRITQGDLNDIYAHAKVVLGDSCLVPKVDGSPMTHYCSDRIPETLGRGGVLIHPHVEGITTEVIPANDLTFNHHNWRLGDWEELHDMLAVMLDPVGDVEGYRQWCIEDIKKRHTYTVRMRSVLSDVMSWNGPEDEPPA